MKYSTLILLVNDQLRYLTVRELAKKTNISPATISRVSLGRTPDLGTYFKLCKYFKIPAPFSKGFKK